MAEKDKAEKVLEDYNDVFADIYNTLLFQKPFLQEDKLEFGPIESIYKSELGELKEQRRDVLKVYRENNLVMLSLGTENQSKIEKNMLIRVMGYDCATYRHQLKEGKLLTPVITIVLNFTDKRWNAPITLHELLDISDELKAYVPNYTMQVFDIAYLEDDVIERFTSDFKLVAKFFKAKRLGQVDAIMQDDAIALTHVEATLELLKVFTQDNRYALAYSEELRAKVEKGEAVYMCNIADSIEQRGIEKGIEKGIAEGKLISLTSLVSKGLLTKDVAAGELGITVEQFEEEMKKAGY